MKGQAYVGSKVVVEAEMMAQIVKVKNNEPAAAPALSLHTS
jgi:hypothetical protein